MPEKDPSTWAAMWLAWESVSATSKGALMAVVIAFLRVMYDDQETSRVRVMLECLLCGAITLCSASVIEWMNLPDSMVIAVGGTIGGLGMTVFRSIVLRWLGKHVDPHQ